MEKLDLDKKEREYWRRELEDVDTIYVVGIAKGTNPRWDKGIWRKFRLYYIKNCKLKQIYFEHDVDMPYWIPRHRTKSGKYVGGYFESNALGIDRWIIIKN